MNTTRGTIRLKDPVGTGVLAEILAGGQCFLWVRSEQDGSWVGVHEDRVYRLRITPSKLLDWKLLYGEPQGCSQAIRVLFAVETDFAKLTDSLPWRSDTVLEEAVRAFPGLRILAQPVGQTLLSFLLSPLKRIDQIRSGLLECARRFGNPLGGGFFSPPTWDRLARISETELRRCGIGYRAKSIHATALFLADHPEFLPNLSRLGTKEAREQLTTLPGVGRKIADCVLLFGLQRLEAFPVDTWISRELTSSYQLEGFNETQLQAFASAHFGRAAGFAQQFLFANARRRLRLAGNQQDG